MLGSNQRPTDYIPTTAFAAAHADVWSLDFLITRLTVWVCGVKSLRAFLTSFVLDYLIYNVIHCYNYLIIEETLLRVAC